MLNQIFFIFAVLLIALLVVLFVYFLVGMVCHITELRKMQKLNKQIYNDITPRELSKKIYSTAYISKTTLENNLKTAYEEYRYQTSLLQSKLTFFFTIQSICGGLFVFLYKDFNIYNNIFSFSAILFGLVTYFLFSNMENVNNKIANIRCYILKMEQINNQPLMNFFENGFYKQAFDTDRNIFVVFVSFIGVTWIALGILLLFNNDEYIGYILAFALIAFLMLVANEQYKAHKSYGFDNKKE